MIVLQEMGSRIGQRDPAGFQDITIMGNAEGFVGVLLDEQHGDALMAIDILEDAKNFFDEFRCQSQRGFIKQ